MRKTLLALGLGLASINAPAADLLQIYQQALASDPQIRAALASRDASYEARPLAKAGLLPNVSLNGDLTYQNQDLVSPSVTANNDFASHGVTLSVVQPLFRRDRLVALDQADDQVEQADAEYSAAQQGLILRVAQTYFGVLSAKDSLAFAEAEKKAIARQLDQAQERFDVGLVAITDVHEAQARYDQARANEISAVNAVDAAVEALREIVATASHQLDGLKTSVPLLPPQPGNIDEWSSTALQNNPAIQSARLSADIARKNIDRQDSGHYPSVDLVAALNRTRSESPIGTDVDSASIGVQLSVPIYSGGGVNASTRQARHQYSAAQEVLDQQRRAVDRQVRDAYRGIQTSISRVQALKATERSAMSALEATQAGFDAGTRTLVDVLNSQRDLFRAMRDHAQSRYDYVINTLSLMQAAGTLSEEDIQRVNTWLE